MAPLALAIAAVLFVCAPALLALCPPAALAEDAPLSVQVDQSLVRVGRAFTVEVSGQVSGSLQGAKLVVTIRGPVAAEQIGLRYADTGSAKGFTQLLSAAASGEDLATGKLGAQVDIPANSFAEPGAYLVSVEVRSGSSLLASGRTWMGMIAARSRPLDVSFVIPVRLGIHRGWDGTFFDQVLEKATLPVESGTETLRGLAPLVDRFPDWRLTLAIEPILLTQLRDMADGYVFAESEGGSTQVGEKDLAAQSAATAILDLVALGARESIEIVTSPYTGADLGLLAAEGWSDGLEAIQMGKQELQSTLGIEVPLGGAYAPGLDITGGSLSYYADASVEYVVVGSKVAGSLAEMPTAGTVAVRAENQDNDRATLVFASGAAGAAMREPWDVNVFIAAFAADLASEPRDALVIAPKDVYGLVPVQYLQQLGELLTGLGWVRTQKLEDLLEMYPPDSRPILLDQGAPQQDGYIESRLIEEVRAAHGPVSDLGTAADASKTPVSEALRALYVAESRWWSRDGVSPAEASMGLLYARQARLKAEAELSKIAFAKTGAPLISAGSGTVSVVIENSADYAVSAELVLSGLGQSFPQGDRVKVELEPGRTGVEIEVASTDGSQELTGTLLVGSTVVDEFTRSVSAVGLWSILPWVFAAAALLSAAGGFLLVRRRRHKGTKDQAK